MRLFEAADSPRPDGYGRAIRMLRAYRKMHQKELADRSGYSVASVLLWESGKTIPGEAARIDLAQSLRVPRRIFEWLAVEDDPLGVDFLQNPTPEEPSPGLYRAEEVCTELGICMNSLLNFRRELRIRPKRYRGKFWYTREHVQAFLQEKLRRARMKSERNAEATRRRHELRRQHVARPLEAPVRGDAVPDLHVVLPEGLGGR